jgi:hypothetical protein
MTARTENKIIQRLIDLGVVQADILFDFDDKLSEDGFNLEEFLFNKYNDFTFLIHLIII